MSAKECKGCTIYDSCIARIPTIENKGVLYNILDCPCRFCLVKVVCDDGSACDTYADWIYPKLKETEDDL